MHRLKQDYKHAEEICLAILRRFPNNVSANTLLGDIAQERDDPEQAVEWYELALELTPDSAELKNKRDIARSKSAERSRAESVEKLGLPTKKFPWGVLTAIILLMATGGLLFAAVYRLGEQKGKDNTGRIVLGPDDTPTKTTSTMQTQPSKETPAPKDPVEAQNDAADRIATAAGVDPARLSKFSIDGRTAGVRMAYTLAGDGDEWEVRSKLVTAVFQERADAPDVELDVIRDGKVIDTNRVLRETYAKTQDKEWQEQNKSNPNAVVDLYFGPPVDESSPQQPANPPADDGGAKPADPGEQSGSSTSDQPSPTTGG